MTDRNKVNLGDKVKDDLTGFSGIVSGIADYLTGCSQACVQPPQTETGTFVESRWFDVDRLTVVEPKAYTHTVTTSRGGPDRGAPTK